MVWSRFRRGISMRFARSAKLGWGRLQPAAGFSPPLGSGRSWHAVGLQAAVEPEQTTHAVGTCFLRLRVSQAWCSEAREIRLDTGRPAESRGRPLGTARIGCPTKDHSRAAGFSPSPCERFETFSRRAKARRRLKSAPPGTRRHRSWSGLQPAKPHIGGDQ
jgi:hypothetical protein